MAAAIPDHGWRTWTAVAVGGFSGTELRYVLGLLFPEDPAGFPWTTLAINLSGSFVLGLLTTLWLARTRTAFWLRAGIGPGILGSFTTFSAVVFALEHLAVQGQLIIALAYLAVSVIAGLLAAGVGWRTGKSIADLQKPVAADDESVGARR
ncbi:CrcB family protein [Arthrobacter sp. M4]|uniref:fluoride efflux transporter FluC n=1 Tax=Arthrobacter sp. M4 TaxID=218160 RepID=UPI001CDB4E6A|nr:CrcB family protein [Arthrobacter sp. M4]MCA4132226.1 CrcB family protein [Arthrobacter sp. M4]